MGTVQCELSRCSISIQCLWKTVKLMHTKQLTDNFLYWLYVEFFVCVYARYTCVCMYSPEKTLNVFLCWSRPYVLRQNLPLNLALSDLARLDNQQALESSCLCPELGLQACPTMLTWLTSWVLEILHSKYFTDWAISPVPGVSLM